MIHGVLFFAKKFNNPFLTYGLIFSLTGSNLLTASASISLFGCAIHHLGLFLKKDTWTLQTWLSLQMKNLLVCEKGNVLNSLLHFREKNIFAFFSRVHKYKYFPENTFKQFWKYFIFGKLSTKLLLEISGHVCIHFKVLYRETH